MSATPAAQLARLKVLFPAWVIAARAGGFTADRPGRHIWAPSLAGLELALLGKPRRT